MTAQIDIIDYLDDQQRTRRDELIALVHKNKSVFIETGNALIELMTDRLYRETHQTFEAFCEDEFGISRRRAYQLAEGARNVKNVAQAGLIPPAADSTARTLSALDDTMQGVAWEWAQVIAQREQPPASLVKVIVADIQSGDPAVFKLQELKREYRGVAWSVMLQFVDVPDAKTMAVVVEVFEQHIAPEDVDLVEYYTARVNDAFDMEDRERFKDQLRGLSRETCSELLLVAHQIQSPPTPHIVERLVYWTLYYDGYQADGTLSQAEYWDHVENEVRRALAGLPPINWMPDEEREARALQMAQFLLGVDIPARTTLDKVRALMESSPTLGEAMAGIPKGLMPLVWKLSHHIFGPPDTTEIQWVAGHVRADEVATGSPVERTFDEWVTHLQDLLDIGNTKPTKPKGSAIESGLDDEPSRPAPSVPKGLEDIPEESGGELDRDAWCTPVWFIEEVVRPWLWGKIELDPCSNPHAQEKIGANVAYFEEHDGLERDWHGKAFMNPPYSQPKVTKFCEKLAKHHTEGDVPMAVAIINSTTDTNAYHALAKTARFEAHPNRRINFWHRDTTSEDYNRHKQTVFFFGEGDTNVIQELLNKGWSIKQRLDYGQDGDSAWAIQELVMAREALGIDSDTEISLWRVIKCLMVHLDQHNITFDPNGFVDQEERDDNDASMDHHFDRADRLLEGNDD